MSSLSVFLLLCVEWAAKGIMALGLSLCMPLNWKVKYVNFRKLENSTHDSLIIEHVHLLYNLSSKIIFALIDFIKISHWYNLMISWITMLTGPVHNKILNAHSLHSILFSLQLLKSIKHKFVFLKHNKIVLKLFDCIYSLNWDMWTWSLGVQELCEGVNNNYV